MQVTFYLTEASANTAAGPFNISGTTSGGAANTVEIQANVSKATLLTGYTEEIANNITGGTVTSTDGTCNTTDTWSIDEIFAGLAPATSILTYTFGGGQYTFNLSEKLLNDITITIANVDLHDTFTCDNAVDTSHLASNITIPAGSYSATRASDITTFTNIVRYKQAAGLTLATYGTKPDGGTFTVPSGTVVTVDISTTCEIYES